VQLTTQLWGRCSTCRCRCCRCCWLLCRGVCHRSRSWLLGCGCCLLVVHHWLLLLLLLLLGHIGHRVEPSPCQWSTRGG
jgi:hypothetical protein